MKKRKAITLIAVSVMAIVLAISMSSCVTVRLNKIEGSGDVKVTAEDSLNIDITGSGKVSYKGSPKITQTIAGSGKIEQVQTTNIKLKAIDCLPEQRNVDACIEIYKPVCGQLQIECITTPCDPIKETFENSCKACISMG